MRGHRSHRAAWPALLCLAALPGSAALGQAAAGGDVRIVNRTTNCLTNCGLYVVNASTTQRAVATLSISFAPSPLPLWDTRHNPADISSPRTAQVLLAPGEERPLDPGLGMNLGPAVGGQFFPFSYTVVGTYVPRPDLNALPSGRPQDSARVFETDLGAYGTSLCKGVGGGSKLMYLKNVNLERPIAVTYRNARQGVNNAVQTVYIAPGKFVPLGCTTEWPALTFGAIAFSG